MTTSYSPLLGMALPVTGELSGTWGDTVNNYITSYVDASVAGTQTISGSQTAVTLSVTTATSLTQAGTGATGSAQYQIINCTGNPASLLTITAPAASKAYLVINATSTSQSVKIVGSGPTTGVTLISGEKAVVAWNGSDFVKVSTTATAAGSNTQVQYNSSGNLAGSANLTFDGTTLTANALTLTNKLTIANGGTNATATPTAGAVAYGTGTAYAFTAAGTSNQVLISNGAGAPTWANLSGIGVTTFSAGTTGFTPSTATTGAVTLAGTLATTNGGTGLTSFTANGVLYASSSSALTTGSALTFDGTKALLMGDGSSATLTVPYSTNGNTFKIRHGVGEDSALIFTSSASASNNSVSLNTWNGSVYNSIALSGANTAIFTLSGSEQMRLTSTGLGIGTSSPAVKLVVSNAGANGYEFDPANSFISSYNRTTSAWTAVTFRAGGYTWNINNSNDALKLDSSGNLGLGVTPSAWGSVTASQVKTASMWSVNNRTYIGANYYYNSVGNRIYINSDYATEYAQVNGTHAWHTAPSGTAGNAISFTQAMTLTANNNLLVGTTSEPSGTGNIVPAAAKGINFTGNTGAAGKTSQLLNWYEEGTWTPVDASGAGLTFSTASGYYTRIGRQVTVFFTVEYPSTADTTAARIGGLPFTALNDAMSPSGGSFHVNTSASTTAVPAAVQNTTRLLASNPATGGSFTNANLSTGYLRGFVTYMV